MRNILQTTTLVSARTDDRISLTVTEVERRDGSTVLVFDQPSLNRADVNEDDRVAIDEATQLALYMHLAKKFGAA